MAEQKQKILIVEDDYRQFQIIRDLLKHDYEILPSITTEREFNSLRSKLLRFLDNEETEYFTALGDYEKADTFIVDFELKQDSDKTGILFCKLAECISNGSKPVLFLTIIPDAEIENQISTVEYEIPKIICENLRKPEFWGNESELVESIVGKSQSCKDAVKKKINKLILESIQKNQSVNTVSE